MTECLDTRGLRCPLPVLKLRKALKPLSPGSRITLVSDDPVALIDVPHFCSETGHTLVSTEKTDDGAVHFCVEKK